MLVIIKNELLAIRKQFAEPRRSVIEEKIQEIKVDIDILIPSEEVIVSLTKDGYLKRTSVRSYTASNGIGHEMKESDYLLYEAPMNTQHHLLIFTSHGNYMYQSIHELPDIRWRDLGQHISSIIPLEHNETIVAAIGLEKFDKDAVIVTASADGLIKQSSLENYVVKRNNRTFKAMGIRKGDTMIDAKLVKGNEDVILFTNQAYALRFSLTEITITGVRTAGVKGINLKDDDKLVSMEVVTNQGASIFIATQRGSVKRMGLKELERAKRGQRGLVVLKELKTNPHRLIGAKLVTNDEIMVIATDKDHKLPVLSGSLRPADRTSNGSVITNENEDGLATHIYKDPKAVIE